MLLGSSDSLRTERPHPQARNCFAALLHFYNWHVCPSPHSHALKEGTACAGGCTRCRGRPRLGTAPLSDMQRYELRFVL
jgi:hypothetical protein